jgi:hypothetical protein
LGVPVGVGQMALHQLGVATQPLAAMAKTIGHGATQLTGDPKFGGKVEFTAGFLDPSHVGAVKGALPSMVSKAGQVIGSVDPYSAMFVPAAMVRKPEEIARAKQMMAEGKSPSEIWQETMIHPGPASHYPSAVPNEYGSFTYPDYSPTAEPRLMSEISDEGLTLKEMKHMEDPFAIPRPEHLKKKWWHPEHPEMDAMFPDMWELDKSVRTGPRMASEGQFFSETEIAPGQWGKKIEVTAPNPEEARIVTAHELQHYVADVGGLEQGNSSKNQLLIDFFNNERARAENSYNTIRAEIQSFIDDSYRQALQEFNIRPNTPQSLELYGKIREEARNIYNETEPQKMLELARSEYILDNIKSPFDMYQHMYGEALANTTEQRLGMSLEERRANPPEFQFRQSDPLIPYRPVPEDYFYSQKDLYDYLSSQEKTKGVDQF